MNSKAPVVLALGAGYLLGRTHRFKWALALGAMAATGRLNGLSGQVWERGKQALQSTPELSGLAESATKLLDAGRGALVTAMNQRASAITDRLEGGAESAQDLGRKITGRGARRDEGEGGEQRAGEEDQYEDGEPEDEGEDREAEDEEDYEDEDQDQEEEDEEEGEEPEDEGDEQDDEDEEPEEDGQSGSRRPRESRRNPVVRRTRR